MKHLFALAAAVVLVGCAVIGPAPQSLLTDPGRLPDAPLAVQVSGLGPCNDASDRTIHLSPHEPVAILVHGCNGSAGRFRAQAEVLAFHGQQAVCFAYDDRDSLMRSSGQLTRAIDQLSGMVRTPQITVIGHNMGGLVARKALVGERPDALLKPQLDVKLVTVSAPFAGIASARMCAVPALRVATLGLNDLACWLISGDNWFEITHASAFIRSPGTLVPQVRGHLKVVTDERNTCRRLFRDGGCIEDDYIFSLAEQRNTPVSDNPSTTEVVVAAGHVEIVGESGVTPHKLIAVLQRDGVVRPTPPERGAAFERLLARLYGQ